MRKPILVYLFPRDAYYVPSASRVRRLLDAMDRTLELGLQTGGTFWVALRENPPERGKPGGPPAAMLSAGNLNTAALTLFLALNLSVKKQLPWILLDDPVQSMDEVHVAQFAALLRTLAAQHERRVIIAVHERALFDYLALELSPANRDDALVSIELSRAPDGSTSVQSSFQHYIEDRALEPA